MTPHALTGGFTDAPVEAARAFRHAMTALSQPGQIVPLSGAQAPAPVSPAAATLILTLLDGTTPVHLAGAHDCGGVRDWITFHCGAPLVQAEQAVFAIGTWDALMPVDRFAVGTAEYPDRAATLIIECAGLSPHGMRLTGPGILDVAYLSLPEVAAFQANRLLFPLGFDCFLTARDHLAALPRSTRVEAA